MPLPKKTLKILPLAAAVDALVSDAAEPINGPPLVVVAAAPTVLAPVPSARCEAASAVQASGVNAGASPSPPVAGRDSTLEPAPATDVGVAADRAAAWAGAGAATAALLLDPAAVTAWEGVEVAMMRGVATSVVVVVSLAEPASPADGVATAGVLVSRRVVTAADKDAPLRRVELLSEEIDGPAAPVPLPGRRAEVALIDDVEALPEA